MDGDYKLPRHECRSARSSGALQRSITVSGSADPLVHGDLDSKAPSINLTAIGHPPRARIDERDMPMSAMNAPRIHHRVTARPKSTSTLRAGKIEARSRKLEAPEHFSLSLSLSQRSALRDQRQN